jgi:C-terminal processing protease CtpA/Prc
MAIACCLQFPTAVLADDLDQAMHGVPKKEDQLLAPDGTTLRSAAESNQSQQQTSPASESIKFELAATKLSSGADMSQDDFRDLGIGTLGFTANQSNFDRYPRVNAVFAGSPAEAAGVRIGDIVLSSDSIQNVVPGSWEQTGWKFHFDHAGTKSQLTVKRGRETLNFTLTRMNIEDLPDPKLRRMYEEKAKALDSSGQGTVAGTEGVRKLNRLLKEQASSRDPHD